MTVEKSIERYQMITDIEMKWCERMTYLVENCRIFDADALYSEYVVDEKDPDDWVFLPFYKEIQ